MFLLWRRDGLVLSIIFDNQSLHLHELENYMRIIPFAICCLFLQNCTTIYFKSAQPSDAEPLSGFPEEFKGRYIMDQDTFLVEENFYSFPVVYEKDIPMAEIDTNPKMQIRDGLFYMEDIPIRDGLKFTIKNDTLHFRKLIREYKYVSDSLVLKKMDPYLILNLRDPKRNHYVIYVTQKSGDDIIVKMTGNLKTEDDTGPDEDYDKDLKDFYKITDFEKLDIHEYLADPTPAEFKKLIKKDFFSSEMLLKKIPE